MHLITIYGLRPWWKAVCWWWNLGDRRTAARVFFGSFVRAARWSWRYRALEASDYQQPTVTHTF